MRFSSEPGLFELVIGHGGRGCKGTELTIRVDPMIEEFVRGLGNGTTKPLQGGYMWYPISAPELDVYRIGNGDMPIPDFDTYQLDSMNKSLILDNDRTNISFLRFKGVSSPEGVTFGVKAIYSPLLMENIKIRIGKACRQLCRDYIVPVTMRLTIVNHEKDL